GVPFTIVGVAPANPVALTPLPVNVYIPTMMLRVGYRWCKDSLASDWATLGAVAILLLVVCCANLGGLLSAQTASRQDEFAIRVSLGAGPLRIARQVITESLLLALAGGAGGLVLSRVFIGALSRMFFSMDD